ncbi:MAG: NAD(P)H-hydrate epimerase [Phycisphaerales bacterium]
MENAALAARAAASGCSSSPAGGVLIVCGPGSTGRRARARRHLHNAGAEVPSRLAGRAGAYRGDASINLEIAERMGLAIADASEVARRRADPRLDTVVDALFGTGLARPLEGAMGSLVAEINALRARGAGSSPSTCPRGSTPTGARCSASRCGRT